MKNDDAINIAFFEGLVRAHLLIETRNAIDDVLRILFFM